MISLQLTEIGLVIQISEGSTNKEAIISLPDPKELNVVILDDYTVEIERV